MIRVALNANITELRKKRGWTQAILAEKMQMTTSHVSRWETGRQRPATRTLKRLADLFGVTIDDLLADAPSEEAVLEVKDDEVLEKVKLLHELGPEDRSLVFRIIDTFATQQRMARMLAGQTAHH